MTPASVAGISQSGLKGNGRSWPLRVPTWASSLVVSLVFLFYAARFFRLISRWAVNIFFWDEWDVTNATLFQHHSWWEIFTWQVGPQREGIGGVFAAVVEPLFRWNSRSESFLVGGIIASTALLALYLKHRLYGSLSLLDVTVPILYFTPRQYENVFVTVNIARDTVPAFLLIVYCLAWITEPPAKRYVILLAINFLAIYTGFGLFIGVLTPVLLILDYLAHGNRSWKLFAGSVLVALLSLASFFIGYKSIPGLDCFTWRLISPRMYLRFVGVMFAKFFAIPGTERWTRIAGMIIFFILLATAVLVVRNLLRERDHHDNNVRQRGLATTALIGYGLVFAANAAYGRACFGIFFALSSRYVIFLIPAFLGLYFFCLTLRSKRVRVLTALALLLAALPASLYLDPAWFLFPQKKAEWKDCYKRLENIRQCDEIVGFKIYPSPEATHLEDKLQYLKQTHQNLYADGD